MKNLSIFFVCVLFLGLLTYSCKDKEEVVPEPTEAEKLAYAQFILEEQRFLEDVSLLNGIFIFLMFDPNGRVTECGKTSYNLTQNGGTVTIDYGNGCKNDNGEFVKGKITFTFTYQSADKMSFKSVLTFSGYSIDGDAIDGKIEGEFKLTEGKYTTRISDLKVKTATGKSFAINSSVREYKQTKGLNTPTNDDDDEFVIIITTKGVSPNNVSYETKTIKELLAKGNCNQPYPVSGTLEFRPKGYPIYQLDFGNGVCDNKVTIKIGNAAPVVYTLED